MDTPGRDALGHNRDGAVMAEFVEIEYDNGTSARWCVEDKDLLDEAAASLLKILGTPDTLKV